MHPVANWLEHVETTIPVGFVDFEDEHDRIMQEVSTRYTNTYIT